MRTEQQDDPLSASKHFAPVLEWSQFGGKVVLLQTPLAVAEGRVIAISAILKENSSFSPPFSELESPDQVKVWIYTFLLEEMLFLRVGCDWKE